MLDANELVSVTSSAVRAIVNRRKWETGEVIAVVVEEGSITIAVMHVSAMLGALKSDELRVWLTKEAAGGREVPVLYSAPDAFRWGTFKKGGA